MARKSYPDVESDEWVIVKQRDYRMACCDCGLVHEIDFRVNSSDGLVDIRARRNNRATAQLRRHRHKGLVLGDDHG